MNEEKEKKNPSCKSDYEMNEEIAKKIISIIEKGDVQRWRKTWTCTFTQSMRKIYDLVVADNLAVNICSMKQYNPILDNIPAGFYVTFKDIKANNFKLKKGSKGVPHYKAAIYEKYLTKKLEQILNNYLEENPDKKEKFNSLIAGEASSLYLDFEYIDPEDGTSKKFTQVLYYNSRYNKVYYKEFRYILEYFFKAEDCNIDIVKFWKLDLSKTEEVTKNKRIEIAEKIKNSYIERAKLTYKESNQDEAYYMPALHKVVTPTLQQFSDSENYYQTLFHEFTHSTGHPSLLNRSTLTAKCGFGSATYSKEELVAELGSLYILNSLDLLNDEILNNSIAYLKGWGQGLKDGIRHNIISTIRQSQKSTNLILNKEEIKEERKPL